MKFSTCFTIFLLIAIQEIFSSILADSHPYFRTDYLSNISITHLKESYDGTLWIGTTNGLIHYNGSYYYNYTSSHEDSTSLINDYINNIYIDTEQRIWVSTNSGVCLFNYEKGFIREFIRTKYYPAYSMADLDSTHLFISTHEGIVLFNKKEMRRVYRKINEFIAQSPQLLYQQQRDRLFVINRFKHYIEVFDKNLNHHKSIEIGVAIKNMVSDKSDNIWVNTNKGLLFINVNTLNIEEIPASLSTHIKEKPIYLLDYKDDLLYIGVAHEGILKYNLQQKSITTNNQDPDAGNYYSGIIDRKENAWLILQYNFGLKHLPHLPSLFTCPKSLKPYGEHKRINFLFRDKQGNIWLNNNNHSIVRYNPQSQDVQSFDSGEHLLYFPGCHISSNGYLYTINRDITEFAIKGNKLNYTRTIPQSRRILSISENDKGEIWFVREDSLVCIDKQGKMTTLANNEKIEFSRAYYGQYSKRMYFLTLRQGIYFMNEDHKLECLFSFSEHPILDCKYFYEDSDSNCWLGTTSNGLYRYNPETKAMSHFNVENGLADNSIRNIIETQGIIVVTTANGISFIYKDNNRIRNHFHGSNILMNHYHTSCTDLDGNIYAGSTGGLVRFNPADIPQRKENIPLYIEDISVNNRSVGFVDTNNRFRSQTIDPNQQILLAHNQNNLAFSFYGIDYENGKFLKYAYRLKGGENEWSNPTTSQTANYPGLAPGHYNFEVKVWNNEGLWSEPRHFAFTIKPPFWWSSLAIVFYIFAMVAIIIFTIYLITRWRVNKATLKFMKQEMLISERISEMKINFFTNISHEFRTPLTLITSPLKQLETQWQSDNDNFLFGLINRNIQKMMRLTDQLLEYNRQKPPIVQIDFTTGDIVHFVNETIHIFQYNADQKGIRIFQKGMQNLITRFDEAKINDILSNLLDNAIKYSPRKTNIIVNVSLIKVEEVQTRYLKLKHNDCQQFIEITVKDNGMGIPEYQKTEIFDRYKRAEEMAKQMNINGFGIGLHYTRQLIENHGGDIRVTDNYPKGTIFSFVIPYLCDSETHLSELQSEAFTNETNDISEPPKTTFQHKTIVVVEDNIDLNLYLEKTLAQYYKVITMSNGQECLEALPNIEADIIITDRIMPDMNGDQLCKYLRNSIQWSTLPIIMLTAKTDKGSQIQGFNFGADAYITKPFDLDYLIARINNLLSNREIMQQKLLNMTSEELKKDDRFSHNINPSEREFLEKLYHLIDTHMSEPNFNINSIIQELYMSRTNFYGKIKNLTGQNPSNFYNTYRMNKALEYIRMHKYNLSEIAEMTGFSSLGSFSRAFKEHFGISPSKYKD